ncbi:protein L [Acinetobacter baumannii]|uniref:protein L n=1 Tax=Acinetobacter baumannii TaxID=470 RepID=UPI000BBC2E83|nr:protein L [Acinetobacter baumannii]PCE46906.1 protein L [Acinetobacter baumannii]
MAAYTSNTQEYLQRVSHDREHWTSSYTAGDTVPVSGIYKCQGCNKEITSNKDDPFPTQNKHQHTALQGKVVWKLIIRTDTNGDNFGLSK